VGERRTKSSPTSCSRSALRGGSISPPCTAFSTRQPVSRSLGIRKRDGVVIYALLPRKPLKPPIHHSHALISLTHSPYPSSPQTPPNSTTRPHSSHPYRPSWPPSRSTALPRRDLCRRPSRGGSSWPARRWRARARPWRRRLS